jgi:hypothetical protein
MEFMLSKAAFYLPNGYVVRWLGQMKTAFADLPESEKASDYDEADRILAIVRGEKE